MRRKVLVSEDGAAYQIGEPISVGNYSSVYCCHRPNSTVIEFAAKIYNRTAMQRYPESKQVMSQEITALYAIQSPYICNKRDVLDSERNVYIICDYAANGTLLKWIKKQSAGSHAMDSDARRWLQQLLYGLSDIHSAGFCHGDIKLENLVLDQHENLRICDFGFCMPFDPSDLNGGLTEDCGTPLYVAPEVLAGEKYDGFKADVWSTGVTLYVMLSGCLPFVGRTNEDLLRKMREEKIPENPQRISEAAMHFIRCCLEVDPAKRWSVEQLLHHPYCRGLEMLRSSDTSSMCSAGITPTSTQTAAQFPTCRADAAFVMHSVSYTSLRLCGRVLNDQQLKQWRELSRKKRRERVRQHEQQQQRLLSPTSRMMGRESTAEPADRDQQQQHGEEEEEQSATAANQGNSTMLDMFQIEEEQQREERMDSVDTFSSSNFSSQALSDRLARNDGNAAVHALQIKQIRSIGGDLDALQDEADSAFSGNSSQVTPEAASNETGRSRGGTVASAVTNAISNRCRSNSSDSRNARISGSGVGSSSPTSSSHSSSTTTGRRQSLSSPIDQTRQSQQSQLQQHQQQEPPTQQNSTMKQRRVGQPPPPASRLAIQLPAEFSSRFFLHTVSDMNTSGRTTTAPAMHREHNNNKKSFPSGALTSAQISSKNDLFALSTSSASGLTPVQQINLAASAGLSPSSAGSGRHQQHHHHHQTTMMARAKSSTPNSSNTTPEHHLATASSSSAASAMARQPLRRLSVARGDSTTPTGSNGNGRRESASVSPYEGLAAAAGCQSSQATTPRRHASVVASPPGVDLNRVMAAKPSIYLRLEYQHFVVVVRWLFVVVQFLVVGLLRIFFNIKLEKWINLEGPIAQFLQVDEEDRNDAAAVAPTSSPSSSAANVFEDSAGAITNGGGNKQQDEKKAL